MCTLNTVAGCFSILKNQTAIIKKMAHENTGYMHNRVQGAHITKRQEYWFSFQLCQYRPCDLGPATWPLLASERLRKWGNWAKREWNFRHVWTAVQASMYRVIPQPIAWLLPQELREHKRAPAGPAPQARCTFLSTAGPFSRSLKTQAGSKQPVPASLLFTPPSGRCHLARAIIHRHTKWPMEEKLVTLEEQMTSDRLCSWFFTTTEETSNCRGGPTPEQTSPFQALGLPLSAPLWGLASVPAETGPPCLSVDDIGRAAHGRIKINHFTSLWAQCCQSKQSWHGCW